MSESIATKIGRLVATDVFEKEAATKAAWKPQGWQTGVSYKSRPSPFPSSVTDGRWEASLGGAKPAPTTPSLPSTQSLQPQMSQQLPASPKPVGMSSGLQRFYGSGGVASMQPTPPPMPPMANKPVMPPTTNMPVQAPKPQIVQPQKLQQMPSAMPKQMPKLPTMQTAKPQQMPKI